MSRDAMRNTMGVGFACALLLAPAYAGARDLKDLLGSLYGGDGILLEPTPPPFPSHAPHFAASTLQGLESLSSSLASSVGQFSLNSTVTGFTFDVERGVPVRTTDSLGPLLAERAETLGRNRLNVAFSWTRQSFDRFEGRQLDRLSLLLVHDDSNMDGHLGPPPPPFEFELDQILVDLDLEIERDIFGIFATYGITNRWDVGAVIPVLRQEIRAQAHAGIIRNGSNSEDVHNFGPSADPRNSSARGRAAGVGDVLLRSKLHVLRRPEVLPDLAVVGQVQLPTGDEDDLLGRGETGFLGLLVASRTYGAITPHVNLGYEVFTGNREADNLRYVGGFDARLHPKLALSSELLGRWEPLGDGIGDHLIDLAAGARWNLWDALILSLSVQFPMNPNHGLRANVTPTVGIEYTLGAAN